MSSAQERLSEFLTPDEVAKRFRCTARHVLNLIYQGALPAVQIGHAWRIERSAVEKYLRHGLVFRLGRQKGGRIMDGTEGVENNVEAQCFTVEEVARICHEANRALCAVRGDFSQAGWSAAPDWQKKSAYAGVVFHLDHPNADPAASHESWLKAKLDDGWHYGDVKDEPARTHPCMVPFQNLPPEQQAKDHLFRGIVHALSPFIYWQADPRKALAAS